MLVATQYVGSSCTHIQAVAYIREAACLLMSAPCPGSPAFFEHAPD
jgi:hypothetical protein